jgi:hypothetical protein
MITNNQHPVPESVLVLFSTYGSSYFILTCFTHSPTAIQPGTGLLS